MMDNLLGNDFTLLTEHQERLNEVGYPYGEVRLTLAIGCFRIVAYLFHQIQIFSSSFILVSFFFEGEK